MSEPSSIFFNSVETGTAATFAMVIHDSKCYHFKQRIVKDTGVHTDINDFCDTDVTVDHRLDACDDCATYDTDQAPAPTSVQITTKSMEDLAVEIAAATLDAADAEDNDSVVADMTESMNEVDGVVLDSNG